MKLCETGKALYLAWSKTLEEKQPACEIMREYYQHRDACPDCEPVTDEMKKRLKLSCKRT